MKIDETSLECIVHSFANYLKAPFAHNTFTIAMVSAVINRKMAL